MTKIKGKYNVALCFCDNIEPAAFNQIKLVCDREEFSDSKIRIMPDVHAGKGCTIGTTMTITDKIVPNMVGVDIGCGMETVKIAEKTVDFAKLDKVIKEKIPSGRAVHGNFHEDSEKVDLKKLKCLKSANIDRARKSIGTLGGGNHFIELDKDKNDNLYIVVHSGSRHLGTEVAHYYQDCAFKKSCLDKKSVIKKEIERLKFENKENEISKRINELKNNLKSTDISRDLLYVKEDLFYNYMHDMKITQYFAEINRKAMINIIIKNLNLTELERFTTVHNYIDTENMILRKGAVSAKNGEKLLIPLNMRDGSLICIGKGNEDWNCSAPHGAGRIMSRKAALENLSMKDYKLEMQGIYSSSIMKETLDEAPMAYKNIQEIVNNIKPTVEIVLKIKPVYNFKASE